MKYLYSMVQEQLLHVESLCAYLKREQTSISLVTDVSFSVARGETLAIIGESGSGKTTLALALMRLLPNSFSVTGKVWLEGKDILSLNRSSLRQMRGKELTLVFQDPDSALNPVFTVGDQVAEVFEIHGAMPRHDAKEKAEEMLRLVGIPRPEAVFETYPHQLSGGMKQRVMIAMAISTQPKVIILDEPTTALDLTVQKEILTLIKELQRNFTMTMVVISHDMGVVAELADHVAVMHASSIIEYGPALDVFDHPIHPYTRALFEAKPSREKRKQKLAVIERITADEFQAPKIKHSVSQDHWAVY